MDKKEEYKSNFSIIDQYSNEKKITIKEVLKFFKPSKNNNFLDIGAGDGKMTSQISKKVRSTTVLEINSKFFIQLKKIPNIILLKKNFKTFSNQEKFDLILASQVLYYFPKNEKIKIIEKMYKLLKDHGKLCIVVFTNSGFMHEMVNNFYPKNQISSFFETDDIINKLSKIKITALAKRAKASYKMPLDIAIRLFTYYGNVPKKRIDNLATYLKQYQIKNGMIRFFVYNDFILIKKRKI